jgi:hypothetical protein
MNTEIKGAPDEGVGGAGPVAFGGCLASQERLDFIGGCKRLRLTLRWHQLERAVIRGMRVDAARFPQLVALPGGHAPQPVDADFFCLIHVDKHTKSDAEWYAERMTEITSEDREFYSAYIRANSDHYPYDSPQPRADLPSGEHAAMAEAGEKMTPTELEVLKAYCPNCERLRVMIIRYYEQMDPVTPAGARAVCETCGDSWPDLWCISWGPGADRTADIPARSLEHARRIAPKLNGHVAPWTATPELHAALVAGITQAFASDG